MSKADKKRKNRIVSKSPGTIPAFLLKTYEILENPVYADIISWNKEGNAFIVKKINDFSERILPKYFKHNNFASFVRQLNMYDFHKARHDNNENEFRHKLFKRGQKHLLVDIRRKTSEIHQYAEMHQIVPAHKDTEIDKFKKDHNLFMKETLNMKNRQQELENFTKAIFTQNNRLIHENKMLWTELMKNKEKSERKIEKLVLMLFHLLNNTKGVNSFPSKKNISNTSEFSKITNDQAYGILDGKPDLTGSSNPLLEQNVVSLLSSESNKIPSQDQDKLFKILGKCMPSKTTNGESEYNMNQLLDELNKGSKSAMFTNYMNYLEECEKNNKNLLTNLVGPGNCLNEYDLTNTLNKLSKHNQTFHNGNVDSFGQKKKNKKGKINRKIPAISNESTNLRDNLEAEHCPIKKSIKVDTPKMNLISPLELGIMNNQEFGLKTELENGLMSPNLFNSPVLNNDYSSMTLNPPTPVRQNLFSNQNMMMDPIQDPVQDFNAFDPRQTLVQNGYVSQSHINTSKPENTLSLYPNFKDPQYIFNELNLYQKQMNNNNKFSKLTNGTNLADKKKLDLDEPDLQTPLLLKNQDSIEAFSPAIYVNTQEIPTGMGYLSNIDDLVDGVYNQFMKGKKKEDLSCIYSIYYKEAIVLIQKSKPNKKLKSKST